MSEKIDYRKELAAAREVVKDLPRTGAATTIDAYWEVCCGLVLVAEENYAAQLRIWENAGLAKEFLDIAGYLEGFDHMLDRLNQAVQRMQETIQDHPSLMLKLLNFQLLVLRRIEAQTGHDLSMAEDVESEIRFYSRNIERADRGMFDDIDQTGYLKSDPIEWSADFEANIDEVERRVEEELADAHRGMGFCFEYWTVKARILSEYGISWRSPSEMNPGVLFD